MKKIFFISLFIFISNVNAEISPETMQLMYTSKINHMTLGLILCEMTGEMKEQDRYTCHYSQTRDKLILSYEVDSSSDYFKRHITGNDESQCKSIFREKFRAFNFSHVLKDFRGGRSASSRFKSSQFLRGFFEHGLTTTTKGKDRTEELSKWFAENLEFRIWIKNEQNNPDEFYEDKNGISCLIKLYRNEYISVRNTNYQGFLGDFD